LEVELSCEAEDIIPRSELAELFPKLALGFIPLINAFTIALTILSFPGLTGESRKGIIRDGSISLMGLLDSRL
jgi:hypothetical protein